MATQALMSLEEFHALPQKEGIDYELVRGRLIEMSTPILEHGEIQAKVSSDLATTSRRLAWTT